MSTILKFFKSANKNTTSVSNVSIDEDSDKSSVASPPIKRRKLDMSQSQSDANRNVSFLLFSIIILTNTIIKYNILLIIIILYYYIIVICYIFYL